MNTALVILAIYLGIGVAALIVFALYAWSQGGGVSWVDAARAMLAWPYYAWMLLRGRV